MNGPRQETIKWSDCGLVCFVDGYGYDCFSRRLGTEDEIKATLESGVITNDNLTTSQRLALAGIIDLRKELELGTGKTDMERGGVSRTSGGNKKTTGKHTAGERLAMRSCHQKHNRLLRRGSNRVFTGDKKQAVGIPQGVLWSNACN